VFGTLLHLLSFNSKPMQERVKTEYNKLDVIDRKVLHWTMNNLPASVPNWIEYTVKSYQSLKGIEINAQTLLNEVNDNKTEE
jgi:hypothetical protein